jgi:hypothetical protein
MIVANRLGMWPTLWLCWPLLQLWIADRHNWKDKAVAAAFVWLLIAWSLPALRYCNSKLLKAQRIRRLR